MRPKYNSGVGTLAGEPPQGSDRRLVARASDGLLGTVVDGRYRVDALLGEGGMGVVYRATHIRLQKALAIKILREGGKDPTALARFQREAQAASAVGNAHIVDVSDFGTLPDSSTYFVMECLEGVDLATAIEANGPMPLERACHIALQLCAALGAAHDAGIVHRDLKPENVFLVDRDGDPDFVKVLDFGIAKVVDQSGRLTRDTDFLGTPHYMSPEQCEGRSIDHRTDIYALGVLLYEMVAARMPHDADTPIAILHKHVYERPTPIETYIPNVPPRLAHILDRCLEKKPERRYQSMREVQADLELLDRREAAPFSQRLRAWTRTRSPRFVVWLGLGAAFAAALISASVSGIFVPTRAAPARAASTFEELSTTTPARGVPELLARPAAPPVAQSGGKPEPPASLAAVPGPIKAESAASASNAAASVPTKRGTTRRKPGGLVKRVEKTTSKPKPRRVNQVREDDVLDPWL